MNKLKNKKILIPVAVVICLAIVGIAVAMSSTNYDLPWSTGGDSSGGGERSSANYQLTDVIGQSGPGTSSSANYKLTGGFLSIMPIDTGTSALVQVYVTLQGDNRPKWQGWEVPLNVGFYPPDSSYQVLLNPGSAIFYFTGTGVAQWYNGGTKATVTVGPVDYGEYDVTVDSDTTLLNLIRHVLVP